MTEEKELNRAIAGALYDFLGALTTGDTLVFGRFHSPTPGLDTLVEWADRRGLSLIDADVQNWNRRATKEEG